MSAIIAPAVIVRSLIYYLHYAILIMLFLLCHPYCAILIVLSLLRYCYILWVGITFGRRVRRYTRYYYYITTILLTL